MNRDNQPIGMDGFSNQANGNGMNSGTNKGSVWSPASRPLFGGEILVKHGYSVENWSSYSTTSLEIQRVRKAEFTNTRTIHFYENDIACRMYLFQENGRVRYKLERSWMLNPIICHHDSEEGKRLREKYPFVDKMTQEMLTEEPLFNEINIYEDWTYDVSEDTYWIELPNGLQLSFDPAINTFMLEYADITHEEAKAYYEDYLRETFLSTMTTNLYFGGKSHQVIEQEQAILNEKRAFEGKNMTEQEIIHLLLRERKVVLTKQNLTTVLQTENEVVPVSIVGEKYFQFLRKKQNEYVEQVLYGNRD